MTNLRIIAKKPGVVDYEEYELPPLGPRDILVKTKFSAVSHATELALLNKQVPVFNKGWDPAHRVFKESIPPKTFPTPLGYENVGEVIKVGLDVKPTEIAKGDVVWMPVPHQTYTQVSIDTAPVFKLSNKENAKAASITALTRVALEGVHDGKIALGDKVAVFGLGTVGLLSLQLASLSSQSQIFGVDIIESRRKLAEKYGASTFNPKEIDVADEIHKLTGGKGVDVAIETSGSTEALHQAIRSCRMGGRVVTVASYRGGADGLFLGEEWHRNRIDMVSSMSISGAVPRDTPRWDLDRLNEAALELIENQKIGVTSLITHTFSFKDAAAVYKLIQERPQEAVKVIFTY